MEHARDVLIESEKGSKTVPFCSQRTLLRDTSRDESVPFLFLPGNNNVSDTVPLVFSVSFFLIARLIAFVLKVHSSWRGVVVTLHPAVAWKVEAPHPSHVAVGTVSRLGSDGSAATPRLMTVSPLHAGLSQISVGPLETRTWQNGV